MTTADRYRAAWRDARAGVFYLLADVALCVYQWALTRADATDQWPDPATRARMAADREEWERFFTDWTEAIRREKQKPPC